MAAREDPIDAILASGNVKDRLNKMQACEDEWKSKPRHSQTWQPADAAKPEAGAVENTPVAPSLPSARANRKEDPCDMIVSQGGVADRLKKLTAREDEWKSKPRHSQVYDPNETETGAPQRL
eukprot:m.21811 g.21811  ORF g.21811 m.21811 type:complete len:122 (+) comp6569_c0_seq1:173-538(+)